MRNPSFPITQSSSPPTLPIRDRIVDSFLSGRKPTTLRAYQQDMEAFRLYLKTETTNEAAQILLSKRPGEANSLVFDYQAHMLELFHHKKLKARTINRRLSTLRSLTKLARQKGIITWKIEVENIKVPKKSRNSKTRGPGRNGYRIIKDEIDKRQDAKGIRDQAILHLLHDLALRRSEVVNIDIEDLDLTNGTVEILGKGRVEKELLSLPRPTKEALARWREIRLETGDPTGPLFINLHRAASVRGSRLSDTAVYLIIRKLGEKTNQRVRPHGIRHTSITEAVRKAQAAGMDVTKVLSFSRHAGLDTLQVYIDEVEDAQGQIADLVAAG